MFKPIVRTRHGSTVILEYIFSPCLAGFLGHVWCYVACGTSFHCPFSIPSCTTAIQSAQLETCAYPPLHRQYILVEGNTKYHSTFCIQYPSFLHSTNAKQWTFAKRRHILHIWFSKHLGWSYLCHRRSLSIRYFKTITCLTEGIC